MPLSPFAKPKPPPAEPPSRALTADERALVRQHLAALVHEGAYGTSDRAWWLTILAGEPVSAQTRKQIFDRIRQLRGKVA